MGREIMNPPPSPKDQKINDYRANEVVAEHGGGWPQNHPLTGRRL